MNKTKRPCNVLSYKAFYMVAGAGFEPATCWVMSRVHWHNGTNETQKINELQKLKPMEEGETGPQTGPQRSLGH